MSAADVPAVSYACVADEQFLRLWQAFNERSVSRAEFDGLPKPAGADPDEMWDVLCKLRQWAGKVIGFNEDRSFRFLLNLTEDDRALMRSVVERSDDASVLGRYIAVHGYGRAFVEARVRSLQTSLTLDGFALDYETVRSVLLGESVSHTPAELVVANYERILEEELTRCDLRPRDMRALYAQLIDRACDLERVKWDMRVLANLDACLAGARGASEEMVFGAARYMWGAGHDIHFVDTFQSTFASLLRKVYFIRSGHPNLSLLPLSDRFTSTGAPQTTEGAYDMTEMVSDLLRSISATLDELEPIAQAWLERFDRVQEFVATSALFNHRQREVLSEALRNPSASFEYGILATHFQASYNTVRADMGRLASLGLLVSALDGHRTVLKPQPRLMDTLERLAASSSA